MVKICDTCGTENANNAKNCRGCGDSFFRQKDRDFEKFSKEIMS